MKPKEISELLKELGPQLTSDLSALLVQMGFSPDAARQKISRVQPPVKKLSGLLFAKKSRFIYHESDFNSPRYWFAMIEALKNSGTAYGPALGAIEARSGIIPTSHFSIHSGAPVRQKKQVDAASLYQRLLEIGVFKEILVPGIGKCTILAPVYDLIPDPSESAALKARLVTENILLLAIKEWAKKLGIVSHNKVEIRPAIPGIDSLPQVGTCHWDLAAPSYLAPMVRKAGGVLKPAFLVCDVLLSSGQVSKAAVEPFIKKVTLLRQFRKLAPILPMFVADSYTNEAFAELKSKGFIPATPTTLFGKEVADGLVTLLSTLSNLTSKITDMDEFCALFDRFTHIEGAAHNLRGALFELIVARLLEDTEAGKVSVNCIYTDYETGASAEVDVVQVKNFQEVRFIECKGHGPHSFVDKETVEKWVTKTIPHVRKCINKDPKLAPLKQSFEFWVTSRLDDDARAYLEAIAEKVAKYRISYNEQAQIKEILKKMPGYPLRKLLEAHYFNAS